MGEINKPFDTKYNLCQIEEAHADRARQFSSAFQYVYQYFNSGDIAKMSKNEFLELLRKGEIMNTEFLKATYTDKKGNTRLVAQLETEELVDIIASALKKVSAIVGIDNSNPYRSYLYGGLQLTPKELAEKVNEVMLYLGPYFIECFFRMDDIFANKALYERYAEALVSMKAILMRDGKLEDITTSKSLVAGIDLVDDEEDDEE